MPSKKLRARANKAVVKQAPPPAPAKVVTDGSATDDLARSNRADLRAARRAARNFGKGTADMDDQTRRRLTQALTQGQSRYMNHHAHLVQRGIATQDRMRQKLATRRTALDGAE